MLVIADIFHELGEFTGIHVFPEPIYFITWPSLVWSSVVLKTFLEDASVIFNHLVRGCYFNMTGKLSVLENMESYLTINPST
jgi:hypothetical protein